MFERFRGSRRKEGGGGGVAVSDRQPARTGAPADEPVVRDQRPPDEDRTAVAGERRFERDAPAERTETRREVVRERDPARASHASAGTGRHAPVVGTDAMETMRTRQRERFGGIKWGSAFFGWLSAIGLAAILASILVGAGVALGLSTSDAGNAATAETIGLGGGIALLVVLAVAWFCGGYVAGRMARFDGARQGIGVWAWTLLAALVVAGLAAVGGSEYDVFERLNLPRLAIGDSTLTSGGAITGAAAIVVTLLAAVLGGKFGERFHRRVDRVATSEYVDS